MIRLDILIQVLIIRDLEKHGIPHKKAENALVRHANKIRRTLEHMNQREMMAKVNKLKEV